MSSSVIPISSALYVSSAHQPGSLSDRQKSKAAELVKHVERMLSLEKEKPVTESGLVQFVQEAEVIRASIDQYLEAGNNDLIAHALWMTTQFDDYRKCRESHEYLLEVVEEASAQHQHDGNRGDLIVLPIISHTKGGLRAKDGRLPQNADFKSVIRTFFAHEDTMVGSKIALMPYLYTLDELSYPYSSVRVLARNLYQTAFEKQPIESGRLAQKGWKEEEHLPGVSTMHLRFLLGMRQYRKSTLEPRKDAKSDAEWIKYAQGFIEAWLSHNESFENLYLTVPRYFHSGLRVGQTGLKNLNFAMDLSQTLALHKISPHALQADIRQKKAEFEVRFFGVLDGQPVFTKTRAIQSFEDPHWVRSDLIATLKNTEIKAVTIESGKDQIEPISIEHEC